MQSHPRVIACVLAPLLGALLVGPLHGAVRAEFPLRVSADRRQVVDHAGKSFLVVGDTAGRR